MCLSSNEPLMTHVAPFGKMAVLCHVIGEHEELVQQV